MLQIRVDQISPTTQTGQIFCSSNRLMAWFTFIYFLPKIKLLLERAEAHNYLKHARACERVCAHVHAQAAA